MHRLLVLLIAIACLSSAALVSSGRPDKADPEGKFGVKSEEKNPWTGLTPNTSPDQFRFAIVSDRTGGHRKGVFSRAVQQVNLLQPEFVMSVGDLIEGGKDEPANRKQWDEFEGYSKQFGMPFFYCPGNHDADSTVKANVWKERLGRPYYHFTYKNCLFLVLNSNDGKLAETGKIGNGIGKDQLAFIEQTLKDNDRVRWTFVFLHHPLWAGTNVPATRWLDVEKALAGRKHNAFCGHVHVFRKFLRNGTAYYQLATTGGGSAMRGVEYGEFDQVAWVTMNANPVISQVALNGVMRDDLSPIETEETGTLVAKVEGLVEVSVKALLGDKPAFGMQAVFIPLTPTGDPEALPVIGRWPTGRVGVDGEMTVYQNRGPLGLKPGRYAVTFEPAAKTIVDGVVRDNPVPEKYRTPSKTPLRIEVKPDVRNRFEIALEP